MACHDAFRAGTGLNSACPLCGSEAVEAFAEAHDRSYFRCGVCQLTALARDHLPDRETELATYRLHQNDPRDPRYRAFLSRLTEPLRRRLEPGMVGLDFGCGPGPTIAPMLAEHGFEVVDYDPFFRPCPAALGRRYDFIACSEVAEHLHAPGRELRRLDGLLRPGGWLGVMTRFLEDDGGFADWWYRRDPTHVCFFRRETISWIAARFGWEVMFAGPSVALFHKPAAARPSAARSRELPWYAGRSRPSPASASRSLKRAPLQGSWPPRPAAARGGRPSRRPG